MTVTVVALRTFDFHGEVVHGGQAVTMSPIEAAVHGRLEHVSLDPQARPTYRTRDLVATPVRSAAEPESAASESAHDQAPMPNRTPRRRSRTRRRKDPVTA